MDFQALWHYFSFIPNQSVIEMPANCRQLAPMQIHGFYCCLLTCLSEAIYLREPVFSLREPIFRLRESVLCLREPIFRLRESVLCLRELVFNLVVEISVAKTSPFMQSTKLVFLEGDVLLISELKESLKLLCLSFS